MSFARARRVVIALGGNAIAPAGTPGTAAEQTANLGRAMKQVAELVDAGIEVVLTHGNGPQVGNILIKNEIAREVVPPDPLDWCVAQTQATIGFTAASALSHQLDVRGVLRPVVPIVSRVLVSAEDPAWQEPTKPIGPYLTDPDEVARREQDGRHYVEQGSRGWRRVVASPTPLESLELETIELLLGAGAVVIANGGGGVPEVHDAGGPLRGVEAVVDKDRSSGLLADELDADTFVILTDVRGVAVDFDRPDERWLERVRTQELAGFAEQGHFRSGSMGPKVEAALRFVRRGSRRRAAIGALDDAVAVVRGRTGTQLVP